MVVLITGASRGIGASTVLKFAQEGHDVIINYNSNLNNALDIQKKISNYSGKSLVLKCDISNEEEVKQMIDKIISVYGRIDCVVNNASIANDTLTFDKTADDFRKILNVNLIGTYLVSKYASIYMNRGSIVNVASNTALNCYYPYGIDYDASKAGIISLTHNLAIALAPNIRVNAVAPGWVDTDMNIDMDEEFKNKELDKILIKRFANPEEIAKVIYFLCSDNASYINNSIIRVDGGTYGSC